MIYSQGAKRVNKKLQLMQDIIDVMKIKIKELIKLSDITHAEISKNTTYSIWKHTVYYTWWMNSEEDAEKLKDAFTALFFQEDIYENMPDNLFFRREDLVFYFILYTDSLENLEEQLFTVLFANMYNMGETE